MVRVATLMAALLMLAAPALAAPRVDQAGVSPVGWNSTDRIDVVWSASQFSGAGAAGVEMHAATDGSAELAWQPLAARAPAGPGLGSFGPISLAGAEGRRALRLVVSDASGETTAYLGTLLLDRTAPRVRTVDVVGRTPETTTYRWVLDDGGGAGPDPLGAAVEVSREGALVSRTPVVGTPAPTDAVVAVPGGLEGVYDVTLVARDLAGLTSRTALPPLWVDRTAPSVAGVHVRQWPTVARPVVELGYSVVDAGAGVAPGAMVTAIDLDSLAVLAHAPSGPGTQSVGVDLPGGRPVRIALRVSDRAGNVGESRAIVVDPSSGALGAIYDDARATLLRPAQLGVWVSRSGMRLDEVRVHAGRTITVAGVLRSPGGLPLAAQEVEVRDARDRLLGRTTTGPGGDYSLLVRPVMGGRLAVGVPVGGELLPAGGGVDVRVVPRVRLQVSARMVRARGAPLVLTATVSPTPRALGVSGKNVVFEWRDPFRGQWRPMANARLGRDGRARVRWRFNAGGFRVPVRVRLPPEPGWATEAALTRPVAIVVR